MQKFGGEALLNCQIPKGGSSCELLVKMQWVETHLATLIVSKHWLSALVRVVSSSSNKAGRTTGGCVGPVGARGLVPHPAGGQLSALHRQKN